MKTCKFGMDPRVCSLFNDYRMGLKEIAGKRDNYQCEWCPVKDITTFNAIASNPKFQELIAKEAGFEFVDEDVLYLKEPFFCDLISTQVVTPCKLTSCRHHTALPYIGNCLRRVNDEDLSLVAAAFYLGIPQDKAQTFYTNAMRKMRFLLVQKALSNGYIKKSREFNRKQCIRCGALFNSPIVKWNYGLGYCSKSCKKAKPSIIVGIEYEYGADFVSLLHWCSKTFADMTILAETLGISIRELEKAADGYIYIDYGVVIKEFEALRYARKKMMRKLWNPPKTAFILSGMTTYLKDLISKQGEVSEDTSPVLHSWSLFFSNLTAKG